MLQEMGLVRDFAVVMAVAGGALVLFRRLGQPAVPGYLLAGIIVGRFALPGFSSGETATIRLLADLGLVLLLFAMGLELGWERIRRIGLRAIFIGSLEIAFMIAVGYQIGRLLAWTWAESVFLGGALSISSSAVLMKMLRDSGKLFETHGRLIIGILVVEDFAAVILLSILSAVAASGTTSLGAIGFLAGKLALFAASALVLGGLAAPWLIRFVARFDSQEVLLITGLGICFGLALVASQLGISAAAGAFLIGTVLGDTEHSEKLLQAVHPVRDMFAALFFVSIGMLVDTSMFTRFLVPAVVVTGVFVAGKIVANTVASFFAGHDGRTSLAVGMGMPQSGEFSLAMVKVGADYGVVGGTLYPSVAVSTLITSFLYPFIFRSVGAVGDFLEHRSPRILRQYVSNLSVALNAMRTARGPRGQTAQRIQGHARRILINIGIIVLFFAIGTFALGYSSELAEMTRLGQSIIGMAIGIGVLAFSMPSAVVIARSLHGLADELTVYLFSRRPASARMWTRSGLRAFVRNSMTVAMMALLVVIAIPFMSGLMEFGIYSILVPGVLLAALLFFAARSLFKIHGVVEQRFGQVFWGRPEQDSARSGAEESDDLHTV